MLDGWSGRDWRVGENGGWRGKLMPTSELFKFSKTHTQARE